MIGRLITILPGYVPPARKIESPDVVLLIRSWISPGDDVPLIIWTFAETGAARRRVVIRTRMKKMPELR
ncbi:MAG: hypothetical protein GYA23_12695 [Methanomicrobiales archaeon]|nr:hypothetical protein [Methanomicrobiales archaeon]